MAREMGENMDDEIEAMAQEEFDKSGPDVDQSAGLPDGESMPAADSDDQA